MRTLLRIALVLFAGLALLAATVTLPRFVPVTVALGPCLRDWTSPTSYLPRASPMTSTDLTVEGGRIRLCYGRPSARGRAVFGALVPFGRYWRLGANEPTRLFTNVPLEIAGISVPPGRYSVYALPDRYRWDVAINRSTFHWGTDFSDRLLAREVGRSELYPTEVEPAVESLTLRLEPVEGLRRAALVIEWETTRVVVPITVRGGG